MKPNKYFYLWLGWIAVTMLIVGFAIEFGNYGYFVRVGMSIVYFLSIWATSHTYYIYLLEKKKSA